MRPNLSLESIAGALTVLGTSVLIAACGGEAPKPTTPVNANEVTPTSGEAKPGDAHCGADKPHKDGEAKCAAGQDGAKPTETTPAPGGETKPEDAPKPSSDATPTDAKPADATAAAAAPKPAAKGAKPAAKKGGAASCGAGTCSAKK
ncbi:MAG: hypothetical protein KC657_04480 [Myxococcales bacterium]|nr:hypothetical protein [Myxococcales bacterium]